MKIKKVIKNSLCVSCGLCSYDGIANMELKNGISLPKFNKKLSEEEDNFLYDLCPGKGYNILSLGKSFYEDHNNTLYDYRAGYYRGIGAAHSIDEEILEKSSSGGMIPALALYLLTKKMVDGIITVKFVYTGGGPIPKPFIAKSKEDLLLAQGSKYMSIPLLSCLNDIIEFKGNLAVIGTPCQIAGIRLLQSKNESIKNKIKYTISNFCGGYRDYRETLRIFNIYKVVASDVIYFSYRGKGQPGMMSIYQKGKKDINIKYPDYSRLTGYPKYNRCLLCVDATGELADVSFGDAWLKEYLSKKEKWSFYLCRTTEIENILKEMKNAGLILNKPITLDKLILSQKGNMISKKERQYGRNKLYKILRKSLPYYDGGVSKSRINLILEIKVYLSHKVMYLLEKIGLYLLLAKLIKRVKESNYEI